MAMPGSPVSRPQASAMCTAAASWRTCTRSMPASSAASKIDMMWLPDSVKMRRQPSRASDCATMVAPRSGLLNDVHPGGEDHLAPRLDRVVEERPGVVERHLVRIVAERAQLGVDAGLR